MSEACAKQICIFSYGYSDKAPGRAVSDVQYYRTIKEARAYAHYMSSIGNFSFRLDGEAWKPS